LGVILEHPVCVGFDIETRRGLPTPRKNTLKGRCLRTLYISRTHPDCGFQTVIVVDPDPHWETGSGLRGAKRAHNIEKREEISCFEMLDVLC
jgi:hypothetical protein